MLELSQRSRRVVVSCMAYITLSGLSACGGAGDSAGNPPSSGPLDSALSVKSTDLGTVTVNSNIHARDGAYSGTFQGYSVWLYGDTFLGTPNAAGRTYISNSWSYTTDLTAADGITGFEERLDAVGAPAMILEETPDEQAFNTAHYGDTTCQVQPCGAHWSIWPASIVTDPVSSHALVFYMVESVDPAGNFRGVGSSVALWAGFDQLPQRPSFSPAIVADHPDLMFSQYEPTFGSASLISGAVLYVYGCGSNTDGLDKGCRLGRTNPATAQDRTTWTFYAGSARWSTSVGDAIAVFNGRDILSVSWNNYLQRYVALYSVPFSQDVVLRTAAAPEGPWSDELKVFTALDPSSGSTYDAHAHSEYDANGGQTIYVTYSRGLGGFVSEVRLVRVDLELTGALL